MASLHLSISLALIFLLALFFVTSRLRTKLPPGPTSWPILGSFHKHEDDRPQYFDKLSRVYGNIMSVMEGPCLQVIVSSAELAKEVLKEEDLNLAGRPRGPLLDKITKNGSGLIWTDYGSRYVALRKACATGLFSPNKIEALRPIREDEVRAMIKSIYIECTNPANYCGRLLLRKHLQSLAFNIITRMVLGKKFTGKQGVEFKKILENETRIRASLALTERFRISHVFYKELSMNLICRNALIQSIIEEKTMKKSEEIGGATNKQNCLVDTLIIEDENKIVGDSLTGLVWDMIAAGKEPIAIAIEWAMAELVKNPKVQQKAQEELDKVVGFERVMNESDIANLPYLQCVVKEALRLHPPTPLLLPHKACNNVKIGGYDVPKGANVYVNVYAIARKESTWRNPQEFQPERFLEEDVNVKGTDFRLLPFGAGRRKCPAAQLSITLVTLVIGNLLRHFSWSLPDGLQVNEIDMSGSYELVSSMKKPLQVVPSLRLPIHLYNHSITSI